MSNVTVYIYHLRVGTGDSFAVYANRDQAEHEAHISGARVIPCPLILSDQKPASSAKQPKPVKIEIPGICFACGSTEIKPHCNDKEGCCFWVKCRKCMATSAVILGKRVYVLPAEERT